MRILWAGNSTDSNRTSITRYYLIFWDKYFSYFCIVSTFCLLFLIPHVRLAFPHLIFLYSCLSTCLSVHVSVWGHACATDHVIALLMIHSSGLTYMKNHFSSPHHRNYITRLNLWSVVDTFKLKKVLPRILKSSNLIPLHLIFIITSDAWPLIQLQNSFFADSKWEIKSGGFHYLKHSLIRLALFLSGCVKYVWSLPTIPRIISTSRNGEQFVVTSRSDRRLWCWYQSLIK